MAIKILSGFEGGKTPAGLSIFTGTPTVGLGRPTKQGEELNLHRWALTATKARNYTTEHNGGDYSGATITASAGTPADAFDGSSGTSWVPGGNSGNIKLDLGLGNETTFTGYQMASTTGGWPRVWSYEVSNDDFASETVVVDARTFVTHEEGGMETLGGVSPVFTFSRYATSYRYHRLVFSAGDPINLYSIQFFSPDEANNQAAVSGSIETTQNEVFGSFCTHPGLVEFGNTGELPVIEFGGVEVSLSSSRPFARGLSDITAGSDVNDVLKTLNWFGANDTLEVTAAGNFTGATGSFADMTCNLTSGQVALRAGDYYVVRMGTTDPAPEITITNISTVQTTYTGVEVDAAFKTELGTGTLYKITLPEAGSIASTDTDPINIGAGTDVWIPYEFEMDPYESEYYELEIDNGVDTPVTDNTVQIRSGRWAMIRFNIDTSGANTANDCYVSVTDTEFTTTLNQAMTSAGSTSAQVILRGLVGSYSSLDDIRIDDSGTKGAPPEIIRADFNLPLKLHSTDFTETSTITATTTSIGTSLAWMCADPSGHLWGIDQANILRKWDTSYNVVYSAGVSAFFTHCMLAYHPEEDALFAVGDGNILRVDYKQNTHSIIADTNITGVSTVNSEVLGNPKLTYVPKYKAIFAVTTDSVLMLRNERDTVSFPLGDTQNISDRQYAPLYDAPSDSLLFVRGLSEIGKLKISAALGGAASSLYYTFETSSLMTSTAGSLDRMGGLEDGRVFVVGAGATAHQRISSKKLGSNEDEYLYGYVAATTEKAAYHPYYKRPFQQDDFLGNRAYLDTASTTGNASQRDSIDSTTVAAPLALFINYLTGEMLRLTGSFNTGIAYYVSRESVETDSIDGLRKIDNVEYQSSTVGQKLLMEKPYMVTDTTKYTLGRNLFLNAARGSGGITIEGLGAQTITGPGATPTDITLKDYAPEAFQLEPELAFFGDRKMNGGTQVPVNHGANSSAIVTAGGLTQGRAEVVTVGATVAFSQSASTPTSTYGYPILGFTGGTIVPDFFTKYSSHALADSTGEFCINICLTPSGAGYLSANDDTVLFSSDVDNDLTNTAAIVINSNNTDNPGNTNLYRVSHFGVNSPYFTIPANEISYLSVGRDSGGDIVTILNGVEVDRDSSSPSNSNALTYGPVGIGGSNNDAGRLIAGGIMSWALYPSNYVAWPYQEGHAYYAAGPGIQIENG